MDVSVIIVTWNSAESIRPCLRALYRRTTGCSFEVILVDNASADGTADLVEREFPQVRVRRAGGNLGFPRGVNLGLEASRGDAVFLLNPDAAPVTDAVAELWRFLEAHPRAGAAGPRILKEDGRPDVSAARDYPSASGALFRHLGLGRIVHGRTRERLEAVPGPPGDDVEAAALSRNGAAAPGHPDAGREVPCLAGAAMMVRREVLEALGRLDERVPMYFEDLDLCVRIRQTGRSLHFLPGSVVLHSGGHSAARSPRRPLLMAAEDGHAPWLWIREYRGSLHAALYTGAVLAGSLLRIFALAPLYPLIRTGGSAYRRRLEEVWLRASSLVRWACSSKEAFQRRFAAAFDPPPDPGSEERRGVPVRPGGESKVGVARSQSSPAAVGEAS